MASRNARPKLMPSAAQTLEKIKENCLVLSFFPSTTHTRGPKITLWLTLPTTVDKIKFHTPKTLASLPKASTLRHSVMSTPGTSTEVPKARFVITDGQTVSLMVHNMNTGRNHTKCLHIHLSRQAPADAPHSFEHTFAWPGALSSLCNFERRCCRRMTLVVLRDLIELRNLQQSMHA